MPKPQQNYLDYVPIKNPGFLSTRQEDALISITVFHQGFYARVAQKFFHRPSHSRIQLDCYGSCVWQAIDGVRTVYEIGEVLHRTYGEAAQPLYPRLIRFFTILKENRFVSWKVRG